MSEKFVNAHTNTEALLEKIHEEIPETLTINREVKFILKNGNSWIKKNTPEETRKLGRRFSASEVPYHFVSEVAAMEAVKFYASLGTKLKLEEVY